MSPRLLALALLPLAAACATVSRPSGNAGFAAGQAPGGPVKIQFPPQEVAVSKLDLELEGKDDEQLFTLAMAAFEAKDWPRAAAAFARVADRFPGSKHEATALFDAGLAYEQLEEWRLAIERFTAFVRGWEGVDALEASFKIAECQYHLQDLPAAHATLAALAARPGLAPADRMRAETLMGVVEQESGRLEDAERTLRKALAGWLAIDDAQRQALDPYFAAQAQYYLGETYREWFLKVELDPSARTARELEDALEDKATLLLKAQGHYLKAIHMGDARWAVASGSRVGELYDTFRRQLLEAPLPPGLDAELTQAYRDELKKRVRVLADKAVSAYQAALEFAKRQGVSDLQFLGDAQDALVRLKAALGEDGGAKEM